MVIDENKQNNSVDSCLELVLVANNQAIKQLLHFDLYSKIISIQIIAETKSNILQQICSTKSTHPVSMREFVYFDHSALRC